MRLEAGFVVSVGKVSRIALPTNGRSAATIERVVELRLVSG